MLHLANHLFSSFVSLLQNFVQIISNLLSEENRDKWEEAQLVWTFSTFPETRQAFSIGLSHDKGNFQASTETPSSSCPWCIVCNMYLFQPQTTKYFHLPMLFSLDKSLGWKRQTIQTQSAVVSFRVDCQTADSCNWSCEWAQCQAESYLWSNSLSHRILALSQSLWMNVPVWGKTEPTVKTWWWISNFG